jgi:hypothetical protein
MLVSRRGSSVSMSSDPFQSSSALPPLPTPSLVRPTPSTLEVPTFAGAHHCASALFRLSGSRDRRAELARSFVGRFVVSWVRRSDADADGDGKESVDTSI